MDNEPQLVKIVIDLPDGDMGIYGEGVWAKPLGNDLYQVENSPWHSREINYQDIVRALAPAADKKPVVQAIVSRSGHRTIHIVLLPAGEEQRDVVLQRMRELGATWEGANSKLFAIDFAPEVDWDPSKAFLQECMDKEWLEFRWSAWGSPGYTGEN
jgi:hypothetical protein